MCGIWISGVLKGPMPISPLDYFYKVLNPQKFSSDVPIRAPPCTVPHKPIDIATASLCWHQLRFHLIRQVLCLNLAGLETTSSVVTGPRLGVPTRTLRAPPPNVVLHSLSKAPTLNPKVLQKQSKARWILHLWELPHLSLECFLGRKERQQLPGLQPLGLEFRV